MKKIIGGEVFLEYDPIKNRLAYLVNKKNSDTRFLRRQSLLTEGMKTPASLLSLNSLQSMASLESKELDKIPSNE